GLHRHQRLLDVLGRVLARGQEHVVVGVVGARPLEDLEMDLLADLGLDSDGIFPGRGAHPVPPRRIIAFYCYTRRMRVLAVETSTPAGAKSTRRSIAGTAVPCGASGSIRRSHRSRWPRGSASP